MGSLAKITRLALSHTVKNQESISIPLVRQTSSAYSSQSSQAFPEKCDVCIIGGGAMGSSSAFWLKRHPEGKKLKVVVIERDNKYTTASTVLSVGGIRQQFSNAENVQLSLFGSRFFNNLQDYLGVEGHSPVDVNLHPGGYLILATTPEGAQILHENHAVQLQYDSKVKLITKEEVKQRHPCLNVDDIQLASIGLENEGWFDPWSLLNGFKRKAVSLGAHYVEGEVCGFSQANDHNEKGPTSLQVKLANGETRTMEFDHCVIATGYESGKVAGLAGIGTGNGELGVPLPVEPKKRYVYYVNAPELANEPYEKLPFAFEPNGVWWRSDGSKGNFLAGRSPDECDEPSCENLDVDYSFFDSDVWPSLAHRAKAMENIKVKSAWGGYYDYNTFDQNGIIGAHPVFRNFYFATGFSGHGIQQSPAVGRSIMELILEGRFKTIDLTRFGFERLVREERCYEKNIF